MRILYVVHQFFPEAAGGTEQFLLNLVVAAQRMGHHVEVVTYSFEQKAAFQSTGNVLARKYRYGIIPVTAVRHGRVPTDVNTSMNDAAISAFAEEFLGRRRLDLVHVGHPMRMAPFITAASRSGIPCVLTLTDFWILCPKIILRTSFETLCAGPEAGKACVQLCPELGADYVKGRLEAAREVLLAAAAVTAPSRFAASVIQEEFKGIPIKVVPHGVKLMSQERSVPHQQPVAKIVFGYCGGFSPHKGLHILLNAFRSLTADNLELHIYGAANLQDEEYERFLRRIAADDRRIRFCGAYPRDQVQRVLQSIDVIVVPSLCYETYSFTLHEAFAAGVPVIATAVGALPEEVKDLVNGLTFPLGDETELASKLKTIATDPSLLARMRENLKTYVLPLPEEEAYQYERIYQSSLKRAEGQTGAGERP